MAVKTAEEIAAEEREAAIARGDFIEGEEGDPVYDAEQAAAKAGKKEGNDDDGGNADGKTTHVPYARFKEKHDEAETAGEENKRLKAENEELKRGKTTGKKDDDDAGKEAWEKETDPRKLRELASEAILEGDAKLATKIHNRADEIIEERSVTRAAQRVQQDTRDAELTAAAREVIVRYPCFDETNKKEFKGKAVVEEVLALRDTYLRQGKSAAAALNKAADLVAKGLDIEPIGDDEGAGDGKKPNAGTAREKAALERAAAAAAGQPPIIGGTGDRSRSRGGETAVDVEKMSDAEFRALPEKEKARLRGDTVS